MKRLIAVLVAALALAGQLSPLASAGVLSDQGTVRLQMVSDYDLSSAAYVGCDTSGPYAAILDPLGYVGPSRVSTSGSSTTVARMTSTDPSPFTNVSVGDELLIRPSPNAMYNTAVTYHRYVAAKASGNSITVNAALDISSGASFYFRKLTCGANNGWVPVDGFSKVQFDISVDTINATSIDLKVECQNVGTAGQAVLIGTVNVTATTQSATNPYKVVITDLFDRCRAVYKINTDTGVQAINVKFIGMH